MPRSLWIIAFAVAFLPLARTADAQDGIAWTTDLRAAQQTAAREGKLILVHFYSDNCPPCRALERNVFPRREIAAAVHLNYVPVKVHVDSAPQLADRFRVEAWPTDLILTPAGLEVTRTISPRSPADYAQMLEQIAFQGGVGAGRRSGNNLLAEQSRSDPRETVALAAATAPMNPQSSAPSTPPVAGPSVGSTAPGRTNLYDPREVSAPVANTPPMANPYAPQPASQRYAAPGNPQQSLAAAAPNTAALLKADAARAAAAQSRGPQTPPASASPAPAGRSIYDDSPEQSAAPAPPSVYGPQLPDNPPAQRPLPGPSGSIYGPSATPTTQWPPAGQPPPQAGQRRSTYPPQPQTAQPAQQASAQYRSPQFVEVSKAPPAAIDGFCPVTILESSRWYKGNVRYGAVHGGRTYLFASAEAQKKFLADPQKYAPVLSGCDPVVFAETNQLIDGNHNIGMLIGGKTYFFTSEETRKRFELSPQPYISRAYQAMSARQMRTR